MMNFWIVWFGFDLFWLVCESGYVFYLIGCDWLLMGCNFDLIVVEECVMECVLVFVVFLLFVFGVFGGFVFVCYVGWWFDGIVKVIEVVGEGDLLCWVGVVVGGGDVFD